MHINLLTQKYVRRVITTCALIGISGSLFAKSVDVQKAEAVASTENTNRLVLAAKYLEKTSASDFVIVEYTIQCCGTVAKPAVIASTRPALSQKIISEVAKWQFDERAKDSRVRQRIVFR